MEVRMKILNFSCVEKLQKLLFKECSQTIRPARGRWTYEKERPPRFKVGERVQLMWNQRSKATLFHKEDGTPYKGVIPLDYMDDIILSSQGLFRKKIGEGIITKVFKIELQLQGKTTFLKYYYSGEELAKRDGFNSVGEMFTWFDKRYDLSTPENFWVYRWKWLNDK